MKSGRLHPAEAVLVASVVFQDAYPENISLSGYAEMLETRARSARPTTYGRLLTLDLLTIPHCRQIAETCLEESVGVKERVVGS